MPWSTLKRTKDEFLWSTQTNTQTWLARTKESIWVRICWSQDTDENMSSRSNSLNSWTLRFLLVPSRAISRASLPGNCLLPAVGEPRAWGCCLFCAGREHTRTPPSLKKPLVSLKSTEVLGELFGFPHFSCLSFCYSPLWLSFKPPSESPRSSGAMEPMDSLGPHQHWA